MSRSKPTRHEVREFGKRVKKGDTFVNRYADDRWAPHERVLTVTNDVRGLPFFVLQDQFGKNTVMRGRTLMSKFLASGGVLPGR